MEIYAYFMYNNNRVLYGFVAQSVGCIHVGDICLKSTEEIVGSNPNQEYLLLLYI